MEAEDVCRKFKRHPAPERLYTTTAGRAVPVIGRSIEAYEEGKRLPLFGPMQRLCQALKVSPQELEQNWQQEIDPLERISEQIKQRLFAQ